jgi:polar amino acid transport system substrate-binding protein
MIKLKNRSNHALKPLLGLCVMAQLFVATVAGTTLMSTQSADAAPAACADLQAKYPALKGKSLVNAINPHTPGYETIDPNSPDTYIGFDVDLGEAIGDCLGFKLTHKPVTFAALLTTLQAGQADIVISDIYATKDRAKAADFVTYLKVVDRTGSRPPAGNPEAVQPRPCHARRLSQASALPDDSTRSL